LRHSHAKNAGTPIETAATPHPPGGTLSCDGWSTGPSLYLSLYHCMCTYMYQIAAMQQQQPCSSGHAARPQQQLSAQWVELRCYAVQYSKMRLSDVSCKKLHGYVF
jgi:hypothetical protein